MYVKFIVSSYKYVTRSYVYKSNKFVKNYIYLFILEFELIGKYEFRVCCSGSEYLMRWRDE